MERRSEGRGKGIERESFREIKHWSTSGGGQRNLRRVSRQEGGGAHFLIGVEGSKGAAV